MKKSLIIIGLVCFYTLLSAQVKVGVKAHFGQTYGNTASKTLLSSEKNDMHTVNFLGNESTKGIGASAYTENKYLFLMLDASFIQYKEEYTIQDLNSRRDDGAFTVSENEQSTFVLEANYGFKLRKLKCGVGPYAIFNVDRDNALSSISQISNQNHKFRGGFNFLLGYSIGEFIQIDLKHSYNFSGVGSQFRYDSEPLDIKSNKKQISLTVGIYLQN